MIATYTAFVFRVQVAFSTTQTPVLVVA